MEESLKRVLEDVNFLKKVNIFGRSKALTRLQVLKILQDNVQSVFDSENGEKYILKRSCSDSSLAGAAASKMYGDIGIQTPKILLSRQGKEQQVHSLQKDVSEIDGLEVLLANNCFEYKQLERDILGKYKWQIFYDSDLQNIFLSFMTKDCLEQLKNIYLVDELRTDRDRYLLNMFLYRVPGSEKYEGIIAIDLDEMAIFMFCNNLVKADFKSFLYFNYASSTPQQTLDSMCYANRVKEIQGLIQDGVLFQGNIDVLKKALNYDFPKEVKKACSICNIHGKRKNNIVEPIERLWEYNNQTIGKDL